MAVSSSTAALLLRRPQLPAERLPKHRRKHRRTSQNLAAIRALLYDARFEQLKKGIQRIHSLNNFKMFHRYLWIFLPITVKLTIVFLVGASVKSTRHRYWPESEPLTLLTRKIPGKLSGRNRARVPSHFSSDQTVADENMSSFSPTSRLKKKENFLSLM